MIIYRDILNGDEIVSDADKVTELEGGILIEVDGSFGKAGAESFVLAGANPSAEGDDEDGGDEGDDSGPSLNFARNFHYNTVPRPEKAAYSAEIKKYLKNVMNKMKELGKSEAEIDAFKKGAPAALKKITGNWSNWDTYLPEHGEPDGLGNCTYILSDFREDGTTPYILLWKHGLEEYKV